jgi:rhomboid-like protein
MACLRAGRISARPIVPFIRPSRHSGALPLRCTALRDRQQTRPKYTSNRPTPHAATRQDSRVPQARNVTPDETKFAPIEGGDGYIHSHVDEKIHYLRPAIWAIAVSSGIYVSLAYLEARQQSKSPPTLVSQVRQRIQSRPSGTAPQDVSVCNHLDSFY